MGFNDYLHILIDIKIIILFKKICCHVSPEIISHAILS